MLSTPLDIKKEEGRVPPLISAYTLPIQRIAYKEEVPYRRCGRVEWAGKFSSKFSGLSETVPDTQDYILRGKNRQEYRSILSKYQEQIRSIQSIRGIWGFAVRCRQDSCSVTTKVFVEQPRLHRVFLKGVGWKRALMRYFQGLRNQP